MSLPELKEAVRQDILARIDAGDIVGDEILPQHPLRIYITGKDPDNLEARIFYRDVPPYFLKLGPGTVYLP